MWKQIAGAAMVCAGMPAAAQVAVTSVRVGSPSNANATVSPATVAFAADADEGGASRFSVSAGASYASGDFGSARDTSIVSVPIGARLVLGGVRLSATIPWMRIRGNGTVFTGIDSTPVVVAGGGAGRRITHSGLGDLTLGGAYALPVSPVPGVEVELSGRIKIPTATDESRLSSGKVDYAAGVQVSRITGPVAPFVSVTYRALGDTAAYRLRDGFAASAGASLPVGHSVIALLSYHYAQRAGIFVRDSHELFGGLSAPLPGRRLRLNGFATKGLSNGAANVSGGLSLTASL